MTREHAAEVIEEYMRINRIEDFPHTVVRTALDMAIAALREQETVTNRNGLNGWISVEDRLPDDSAGVNLCTRSGIVGTGFYDKYTKNWVQYYSGGALCVDVTHWMPLPEPPEVEG